METLFRALRSALLLSLLLPVAAAADTKEPALPRADVVHADLPLFGSEMEDKWPRAFFDASTPDFGCASRVAFGDWMLRRFDEEGKPENDDSLEWYDVLNYGAFHCFAQIRSADEREDLANRKPTPSFFVFLGTIERGGRSIELWAIQMGARPGSDYILLSRPPGPGMITAFSVLQRICPKDNVRGGKSLNGLLTSYCAINSKSELRTLAGRMTKLPLFATLTLAPPAEEGETDEGKTE